jgi:hypothetical protein
MKPEVLVMRSLLLSIGSIGIILAPTALAQVMVDASAATAGGVTGAAAGKKVSEGLSGVFGKVAKQSEKAASQIEKAPAAVAKPQSAPQVTAQAPAASAFSGGALIEASPGMPKSGGVPLPPPPAHKVIEKPMPFVGPIYVPEPPPPPPPPPEATPDDLRKLARGESREDVLKFGEPASRITMFDDGHLQETFRYPFGVVRFIDGAVVTVDVK